MKDKLSIIGYIVFILVIISFVYTILWGISSTGRAPALQAEGYRFDSVILHQFE